MKPGKIAIEEHVAAPAVIERLGLEKPTAEFDGQRGGYFDGRRAAMRRYLLDIHGQMLADMDAAGIEMSVLSLTPTPGIQSMLDKQAAIDLTRVANDYFADQVAENPQRFQAFAALPMQDPDAAARELTRCVNELGFRGASINGFTQVDSVENDIYLDDKRNWDFWGTVESLGVPVYLHPRDPMDGGIRCLNGQPWLWNSRWAFSVETSSHALRLMSSGLFDKYPKLNIILGHLGEMLPNVIWRIDHRIQCMPDRGMPARKPLDEYFRNNFYITTSGSFCTSTLMNAIQWVGAERIIFAVDYPFEKMAEAAAWFDRVEIMSEADWTKIARTNAEKLLKLETLKAKSATA